MRKIRTFLAGLLFYTPFAATAIHPAVVGLLVTAAATVGFSVYRSFSPVNLTGRLEMFSSCWSCDLFSGVMRNLSEFIPKIYSAIGVDILPIAAGLTFVWFAWRIMSDYLHVKEGANAWDLAGKFGTHIVKLVLVAILLATPFPRLLMDVFLSPIMNIGLSYNHIAKNYVMPADESFESCMIATALHDRPNAEAEAFGPKLRHNMACQLANFHQMTGLGMTVGWTFLNMAFSREYMYGPTIPLVEFKIPVFPNVVLFGAGLLIFLVFLWALFPIPLYFLTTFIKLSMDLIMLPLMLFWWLFKDWKGVFPAKMKTVKDIIEDAAKGACGIALVGLFVGFSVLFITETVGDMDGTKALVTAFETNDGRYLMDALFLNNGSMIQLIFVGIFIGMFMNAIPKLAEELFKTMKLPSAEPIQDAIGKFFKGVYKFIKVYPRIAVTGKAETPASAATTTPAPPPTPKP